jgi:hypothetical protein
LLTELGAAGWATPVVIYSAQDIGSDLQEQVAAAMTKSKSSLDGLTAAIRRLTRKAA